MQDLLDVICCPVAGSSLSVMTEHELGELNAAIAQGRARYGSGAPVEEPLEAGLTTGDGASAYRVRDGVPHLVPALRIVAPDQSPGGSQDASEPSQPARLADTWEVLSHRWHRIHPPLRPAPQDVELFERTAGEAFRGAGGATGRTLLLGVTPEIATMRRPAGTGLLALDASPSMVRNVWPAAETDNATVALADWKAMPVRDATFRFVIGDGILTSQRYPADFDALAAEVRRVMADDGTLVLRLFARPDRPDPPEAVFADLLGGRMPNFDVFHWRLQMSLHRSLEAGTRLGDVWEAWCDAVPDPQALMRTLGWAPDAARVFDTYEGADARISFPTVSEVRAILSPAFEQTACHVPEYEMGERYPTVAFRPGTRGGGRARS